WAAVSDGGVARYHPRTNTFTTYRHQKQNSATLSGNLVVVLGETRDSTVWAGTRNGLNRFEESKNAFIPVKAFSGMAIFSIEAGPGKTLFLGTSNGLFIYDRSKKQVVTSYVHQTGDTTSLGASTVSEPLWQPETPNTLWVATSGGGLG